MHTFQLLLKGALKEHSAVEHISGVLLTNKKPVKSIASMFRDSGRLRSVFKDEQINDAGCIFTGPHPQTVNVLGDLNYAPQRMSSRSRPFGRVALKIKPLLSAFALEATTGSGENRKIAL